MSQEQPRHPHDRYPINYEDIFHVSGDLAKKPVAPEDAAMMQTEETRVLGQTQPAGAAAAMQSAANRNEQAGLVGHWDATDATRDRGVAVTQTHVPGRRIVTEAVAGQAVAQYCEETPVEAEAEAERESAITIGEALEATAETMTGNKAVDQSDAAAIQAAEMRAIGSNVSPPAGMAAMAQSAAAYNSDCKSDEEKINLADVLTGATTKLPADKAATLQDAERIASAEVRNNPGLTATPGGVAASVAAAARLNQNVK